MLMLLLSVCLAEPSQLESLWKDLGSDDDARVARATLQLASDKQVIAFLKQRLRPVQVDKKRLLELFDQLDADEFEQRQKAIEELQYLERFIKDDLKQALQRNYSLEVKARLKELLARVEPPEIKKPALGLGGLRITNINGKMTINGMTLEEIGKAYAPQPAPKPPIGWTQAVRAIAILEHLATPEARQLLEKLAQGEADAAPTQAAQAALERLKK
ncbi:MAG: hypothetical protein SNJ75_09985 [Gemmataceae bacterium]